jgi:hypothetical protein
VGLDNSLRFEPIWFKKSIPPEHSFRNSPGKSPLLLKSPDEIDVASETVLEKGQSAKTCRSKAATAAEIASRLTQNSRLCRSSWALCQIVVRQIATLPLVRGKRFDSILTLVKPARRPNRLSARKIGRRRWPA